jgi:hypothetical protein
VSTTGGLESKEHNSLSREQEQWGKTTTDGGVGGRTKLLLNGATDLRHQELELKLGVDLRTDPASQPPSRKTPLLLSMFLSGIGTATKSDTYQHDETESGVDDPHVEMETTPRLRILNLKTRSEIPDENMQIWKQATQNERRTTYLDDYLGTGG